MKTIYTTIAPFIQDSPAAIDRTNGILYINPKLFNRLTPFQKKFVKYHEMGHYKFQTSDELVADAYAFDQLAGTEFRSLKQALGCINDVLKNNNPTKQLRYDALYRRVLEWDYKNTGNLLAKQELDFLQSGKVEKWVSASEKNTLAMSEFTKTLLTSLTGDKVVDNNASQTKTNTYLIGAVIMVVLFIFYKTQFSD
ncbi:MAG: hypothetical protein H6543_03305 [Prevotellaceae bacterium]|jgi:hypothetical protein|nr:hypothetical protein [Prevotellaceae bacterium]